MKLDRFLDERRNSWAELEDLIGRARGRPERLGATGVRRLGALYRRAAGDLALARRTWPSDPVVLRLEDLVARARALVYDRRARGASIVDFYSRRYWALVAERPVALALAAALLFAPAGLAVLWALQDPAAAGGLVPEDLRAVAERRGGGADLGLGVAEQASFASQILTNNIQVTFLSFGAGILLGIGTAAVVAYNGIILGTVLGLSLGGGSARLFLELVVAHGVLELSCIIVAAAAGLRMGWAVVSPGRLTRVESLVSEARKAVTIILGTAPWLVVAGVVEGFVTPAGLGLVPVVAVGGSLGGLYWALIVGRGFAARQIVGPGLTDASAPSP